LQFLGDTGNVAAKLEAQSKNLNCKLVVSLAALDAASISAEALETAAVSIPGRAKPMNVAVLRQRRDLEQALEQPETKRTLEDVSASAPSADGTNGERE
jgi:adenylate cyclase